MSLRSFAIKPIALAALLGLAGAAHASFITYDSSAAFAAATSSLTVGTDTFANLQDDVLGASITRSAGAIGYTASDSDSTSDLFGLSGALSTNANGESITFGSFGKTVFGVGGNFYNTLITGAFAPGEGLTLTVVDAAGSHDFLYSNITGTDSYFGIVSTSAITSLTITGNSGNAFATTDNLQLAAAVPEPETYALMLAGLGIVGFLRQRQQRAG